MLPPYSEFRFHMKFIHPEDDGSIFLQNVGAHILYYMLLESSLGIA